MKKILTSIALLLAGVAAHAQTTATNWTAPDCSGTSHTLFSELDGGNVIVFAWVMPCGSCIAPSAMGYKVVQNYATSNPGKVHFYISDDLGDATCATISSWVTTNSVGNTANMTIMNNAGNLIDESNFGGSGMPHIVIMGGSSHNIYFNKKGLAANDSAGMVAAINTALGSLNVPATPADAAMKLSPNPVNDLLTITNVKGITDITITSVNGQTIKTEHFVSAKMNPSIDLTSLASGLYMVKITDADNYTTVQKVVKE
ncbi:MAG: hypothetical protein JWQ38_2489 [Flavipsychrobacter sp.]|nr:hypothetical protein [Flavipsychrobacter sp.]